MLSAREEKKHNSEPQNYASNPVLPGMTSVMQSSLTRFSQPNTCANILSIFNM